MAIDLIEKSKCTGCKMCLDICPRNAIKFYIDNNGFWYPSIDKDLCINCNLCSKKCPCITELKASNYIDPEVYAVWSLNDKVRYKSTSGGIYFEIARRFIEDSGYISGCVFTDEFKSAKHIVGKNMDDLKKIMGSKYFQSDTEGIYKAIKKILDSGDKVLFTGTPCQIAALISYLGEKPRNLYLCDFICKGINSPKAYKAYLKEIEDKYNSKIISVRQKSKKTGWESLATNIKFENGKEYHKDRYRDWWIQGYTCGNLFMRDNCQNCLYKGIPRLSDLTLGDFWGIEGCSDENKYKGISVCIINSDDGKFLVDNIKDKIHIEKRSIDEVRKRNPYLFEQATQKGNRDLFFSLLDTTPFSKAVKMTYVETLSQKSKRYVKILLKKLGRKKW